MYFPRDYQRSFNDIIPMSLFSFCLGSMWFTGGHLTIILQCRSVFFVWHPRASLDFVFHFLFTLLWNVIRRSNFLKCRNLSVLCSADNFHMRNPKTFPRPINFVPSLWCVTYFCAMTSNFTGAKATLFTGQKIRGFFFESSTVHHDSYFWRSFIQPILNNN